MRRSLKHGPIAWRTALRWRSRFSLAFAAIAPAVFLPPLAIARLAEVSEIRVGMLAAIIFTPLQPCSRLTKFAKSHAGILFGTRERGLVGGDFPKPDSGSHHEIGLLLGQHFRPLRDSAAGQPNRTGKASAGVKQRDRFRFVHKAYV